KINPTFEKQLQLVLYHFLGLNQSIIGKCFLGGHIALANGDQIVWYLHITNLSIHMMHYL
ncbi:MAG: hypothetical protein Q7U77_00515, partial [Sediminibacterium sp.]|uniref:hypothetical protein n=1 Tax=Sediminibacterium sp. TaxID=1917865 RepID=UPI002726ABF7